MAMMKRFAMAVIVVLIFAATAATVYAASTHKTPVEMLADLTGRDLQSVIAERQTGKGCGTIAQEAGKLEEFRVERLAHRKEIIESRVVEGKMTRERADQILKAIEKRQAACAENDAGGDGGGVGGNLGAGFGRGGWGGHAGQGHECTEIGCGQKMRLRDGSCQGSY